MTDDDEARAVQEGLSVAVCQSCGQTMRRAVYHAGEVSEYSGWCCLACGRFFDDAGRYISFEQWLPVDR